MKKKKLNLNEIAKEISEMEHGKVNLSIGQIKEVMKCFNIIMFAMQRALNGYLDETLQNSFNDFGVKHDKTINKKIKSILDKYETKVNK